MATPKKDQATTAPTAPQESGLRFFREILGQDWVVSHLKAAMLAGRLSHAYLFLGPGGRGQGHHRPGLGRGPELHPTRGRRRRLRDLPLLPPHGWRAPIPTFW